jgi:homoserine kinase
MKGRASAPASSGNLGPGFDVLALALDLMCHVTAEPADEWRITQEGRSYEPKPDDFVRRAVGSMTEGNFHLEIDSAIPRGRGLGSSSAVAVAAGAAALRSVGNEPTSRFLFELAAAAEGHPDNAAAAVYGGLVAAGGGVVRHLEVHPNLRIIVGVPETRLPTSHARSVLSPGVDRRAAARSLARVVFLVDGLRTADPVALGAAGGDELHEEPRHDLSPVTARLMNAARRAGALHAAWSGAGPSAIAFALTPACDGVEAAMSEALDGAGKVMCLDVAAEGWR